MLRGWRRGPGVLRGTGHQTIVLDDGRIKLAGGEPSTSLSKGAYARGTQPANGWEFDPSRERYLIAAEPCVLCISRVHSYASPDLADDRNTDRQLYGEPQAHAEPAFGMRGDPAQVRQLRHAGQVLYAMPLHGRASRMAIMNA